MKKKLAYLTVIILIFLSSCSVQLVVDVSFESNGVTTIISIIFNEERVFSLPDDPIKEGYTFSGWFLDATFDTPFSVEGVIALQPEESLTVYAQWTINTYTITFDSDGGSEVTTITQDYSTDIQVPLDPTREGYTFNGWDADIPSTMPAKNLVLKATWTINSYILTVYNEFSVTLTEQIKYLQEFELLTFEVDGYRFIGWFIDENFVDQLEIFTMPSYDLNIYAKYEEMLINEWFVSILNNEDNTITVEISVDGIVNFSGFDSVFKYNHETLKIVSIENNFNAVINSSIVGEIYFNFIDAINVTKVKTEIIKFTFEIVTEGETNFELNIIDLIVISDNYTIEEVDYTVIFKLN